jgi:drug/metabolite transporter (DMT)-like permease
MAVVGTGNAAVRVLPILAVLVAASIGASSGLYIKGISVSSFAMAGFRMGVPFLVLLPLVARRGGLLGDPARRRSLWFASGLNAVRMLLFIMAYKLTAIGNAVVLLYLWPIFALLIDCVRLRRPPAPAQTALLALAFAGVVVMNLHRKISFASGDLLGSLFMIASAFLFAATVIIFKGALDTVQETDALYFQNVVGALVFLPILLAEIGQVSARDLTLGLAYGASVGLVGFGLFFYAMKRLPLFQYSALTYIEVIVAVAFGVTILGESLTLNQAIGATMIITASLIAQRFRAKG